MRFFYTCLISVLIFNINASAQSGTYAKVYTVMQNSCAFSNCHNTNSVSSGLNLVGTGDTEAEMMTEVYNNLYAKTPKNAFAANKGYKLVTPGDPYSSFLFRKAHGNIQSHDLVLHPDEGDLMPQNGIPLDNKDAEIIRQWILYGAPKDGEVVDTALIGKYYREGGIVSASNPPKAPEEGKGFQMHVGPLFLAPKQEVEFFSKFNSMLKTATEVNKVEAYMGTGYSHHFLLFRYKDDQKNAKPFGLRKDNAHMNTELVSAHQQSETIPLPPGTAFQWPAESYLDLNTHYINYSTTKVLAAEVYVNVYTQPTGTAKQRMNSVLIANTGIYIPNDKKEHSFRDDFMADNAYIWNITSHTHKYGKDYDFHIVNANGELGEQLFEGSCKNGIPGCSNTNYDYQHPPTRVFYPFYPLVNKDGKTRVSHVAKYMNDGPKPVTFGATTDDEMMVLLVMYVTDTAGLGEMALSAKPLENPARQLTTNVFPNPFSACANIVYNTTDAGTYTLCITDAAGRTVYTRKGNHLQGENTLLVPGSSIKNGLYFYKLVLSNGSTAAGKISKN